MSSEHKFLLGFGTITLAIILIGAFFLGKQPKEQSTNGQAQQTVDQSQLILNAAHTIGDPNAPVVVVEFADFQCPACKAAHPIVKQLLEKYPQEVYFIFRHYPLSIHKNSKVAAQAAEAAADQGKFFEMEDKLFTNQADWQDSGKPKEIFEKYAAEIGLDVELFKSKIGEFEQLINNDFALGNKFDVQSTPTFFINGERQPGVVQLAQFESIIAAATQNEETTQNNDVNTSEEPDQPPAPQQ